MALLLWILLVPIVLIVLINLVQPLRPSYRSFKSMPGPGVIISGLWTTAKFVFSLRRPELLFQQLRNWMKEFKETYCVWTMLQVIVGVVDPSVMQTILSTSQHSLKGVIYQNVAPLIGEGLVTINGDKWAKHRKILTPAFHFSILEQFLTVFRTQGQKLHQQLEVAAEEGTEVDLFPTMSRFTLNSICETSMGASLESFSGAEKYRESARQLGEKAQGRVIKQYIRMAWVCNPFKLRTLLEPIHSFTSEVIRSRRQTVANETTLNRQKNSGDYLGPKKQRLAMLDTLLSAEARGEIDAEGIHGEVMVFMFAGHDTTSTALTFTFLLLALHQDVQERVYQEIRSIYEEIDGRLFDSSSFSKMTYLSRIISESMRLYPPLPFISRTLNEDIRLETGRVLSKGTECHLHIFDLHRNEKHFPDPEVFDPDRFLPDQIQERHPFAYLPFSAGPRNCIGQKYAMLQLKTYLGQVLLHFRVLPVTTREELVFVADLVLRTKEPVKVSFRRRLD